MGVVQTIDAHGIHYRSKPKEEVKRSKLHVFKNIMGEVFPYVTVLGHPLAHEIIYVLGLKGCFSSWFYDLVWSAFHSETKNVHIIILLLSNLT